MKMLIVTFLFFGGMVAESASNSKLNNRFKVPEGAKSDCLDVLNDFYKGKVLKTSSDGSSFVVFGVNSTNITVHGKKGAAITNAEGTSCKVKGKSFNANNSLAFMVKAIVNNNSIEIKIKNKIIKS